MNKRCPNKDCPNKTLWGTFNFCSDCGSKLVEVENCICGQIKTDFPYCPWCGRNNKCEHSGEQKNGICLECGKEV